MRALLLGLALTCAGCAGSDRDRAWVSAALEERGLPTSSGGEDLEALLADGLDQDDASAIALSQSPVYRADLARLDSARADLDEAQRPANPVLSISAALGPVSAIATLLAPLESLWQIPFRSEAAARVVESVAESLVQSGLDLARDARLAHIECVLAMDRARALSTVAQTAEEIARIAEARSRLGETSPGEAARAHAEAQIAIDAARSAELQVEIMRARLLLVLGLERSGEPALQIVYDREPLTPPSVPALIAIARSSRPDVRAAEMALRGATARAGWERSRVVALSARIDGFWTQPDQLAMRLGGQIELPIFGANPGGIGRAEAEILRTTALLEAARLRVITEITEARARARAASESLTRYRDEVLPALEEALRVATRTYEVGEENFLVVLDVLARQNAALLREAELVAEERRADAELERAIGARMTTTGAR